MDFIHHSYKNAHYRISSDKPEVIEKEIRRLRDQVESYIRDHPEFKDSLEPLTAPPRKDALKKDTLVKDSPEIVKLMDQASRHTGVGPMAAVAGAIAGASAAAALKAGASWAVVDNGGDLYIGALPTTVSFPFLVGIYSGDRPPPPARDFAFALSAEDLPLAICSSSSKMGHSLSFGDCDLATVFSTDAALADAAATAACNGVKSLDDVKGVLQATVAISGVRGVLIIKEGNLGMAGNVPDLVRHGDPDLSGKVTRAPESDFPG